MTGGFHVRYDKENAEGEYIVICRYGSGLPVQPKKVLLRDIRMLRGSGKGGERNLSLCSIRLLLLRRYKMKAENVVKTVRHLMNRETKAPETKCPGTVCCQV